VVASTRITSFCDVVAALTKELGTEVQVPKSKNVGVCEGFVDFATFDPKQPVFRQQLDGAAHILNAGGVQKLEIREQQRQLSMLEQANKSRKRKLDSITKERDEALADLAAEEAALRDVMARLEAKKKRARTAIENYQRETAIASGGCGLRGCSACCGMIDDAPTDSCGSGCCGLCVGVCTAVADSRCQHGECLKTLLANSSSRFDSGGRLLWVDLDGIAEADKKIPVCSRRRMLPRLITFRTIEEFDEVVEDVRQRMQADGKLKKNGEVRKGCAVRDCVGTAFLRLRLGMSFSLELGALNCGAARETTRMAIHDVLPYAFASTKRWYGLFPAAQVDKMYIPAGHRALIPQAQIGIDSTYAYHKKDGYYNLQKANYLRHKHRDGNTILTIIYANGGGGDFYGPNLADENEDERFRRAAEALDLVKLNDGRPIVVDRGFCRTQRGEEFAKRHQLSFVRPWDAPPGGYTALQVEQNKAITSWRQANEQFHARIKDQELLQMFPIEELKYFKFYFGMAFGLACHCRDPFYDVAAPYQQEQLLKTAGSERFPFPDVPATPDFDSLKFSFPTQSDAAVPTGDVRFLPLPTDLRSRGGKQEIDDGDGGDGDTTMNDPDGDDTPKELSKEQEAKAIGVRIRRAMMALAIELPAVGKSLTLKRHLRPLADKLGVDAKGLATRPLKLALYEKINSGEIELDVSPPDNDQGKFIRIPEDVRGQPVPLHTRRSFIDANEQSKGWAKLNSAVASKFPSLDDDTLAFFFATPTVSLRDSIRSASVERAKLFSDGDCTYSSLKLRYAADKDHVVVSNVCQASMSSASYRPVVAFTAPTRRQNATKRSIRAKMSAFCPCKNGECGGNCAHTVALLRRVAQLQGTTKVSPSRRSESLVNHANAPKIAEAHEKMNAWRETLPKQ
jgi:hypothetical protein